MRACLSFASIGLLFLTSGCATVAGGWKDKEVTVTTEPPGAAVTVDGQPHGQTPAVVKLSRKADHQVVVTHPGYETATLTVNQRLNPWIFGNLLFGGLVGVVVDVCTHATFTLSPDEITLKLQPVPTTSLRDAR